MESNYDDQEHNRSSTSRLRAAYYISQPIPRDLNGDDDKDDRIIIYVVLYGLFLIIIGTLSTTASFFLLQPKLPAFHIDSLAVSDFDISVFGVMGNWDMNIRFENNDTRMQVSFRHIGVYLIYKDEQTLSSTNLTSFILPKGEETLKFAHLQRTEENKYLVGNGVLKKMAMDRKRGEINFNIKMKVLLSFNIGDKSVAEMVVNVLCRNLKVQFEGDNGDGKLTSARGVDCFYRQHS